MIGEKALSRKTSVSAASGLVTGLLVCSSVLATTAQLPPDQKLDFEVDEGLNINYFFRDDKVAAHLLLRSGADPRIIIAFPAGNSGVGVWFAHLPKGAEWQLRGNPEPVEIPDAAGRVLYGITSVAKINAPELRIGTAVLSSVRVLRDYQALGSVPNAVAASPVMQGQSIAWARDRLDGAAGYRLRLDILDGDLHEDRISAGRDGNITLRITGASGETPLTPLSGQGLFNELAPADEAVRHVLAFLSYQEKFLAGSWRFNTYFGRDTLMSVRLLMPVLNPEAVDAGLGAVLARLSDQGEVAHEESIGEFAVLDHLHTDGSRSDAPIFDYKMIDGTFMLAPVARAWLLDDARGRERAAAFLAASDARGGGHTNRRGDDLVINLRLVLQSAAAFAANPQAAHLISIKPGQTVGNWRDSGEGLGRGQYPYDVNAVWVSAALEAAGRFYRSGLLDPYLRATDRNVLAQAAMMAKVWRERAARMFEVRVPRVAAVRMIAGYAAAVGVPAPAALAGVAAEGVGFHALSLDAAGSPVRIMNSDEGFELLFGEPDAKHLDQAVTGLLMPYPAGLMTEIGMLVANPVFAAPELQGKFTRNDYHGTVVWSWQQAVFAAGLARQLRRTDIPPRVRAHLLEAQNTLWAAIDSSRAVKNSELWSWTWADGHYRIAPFGATGADVDESNAAQLWSTVYLAIQPPSRKH